MNSFAIAVHGGARVIKESPLIKEREYKNGLIDAILAGNQILEGGGSALDAVEAAVKQLEDNPLFNAGKGSVYSSEGKHEMEAAIMCGKTLKAGSVAGLQNIRNPIYVARKVMDNSRFVFLSGIGANQFASDMGFMEENDDYFFTEEQFQKFKKAQEEEEQKKENYISTVGAVALDLQGNLAAATSTGGLSNKKYGRIGDSPLIGCGTYANNDACAVSCTGDGEFFIRTVAAHEVYSLVTYKGLSLKEACEEVIQNKLTSIQGYGGLIAVDKFGNIEWCFNSGLMFRASKKMERQINIEIF